MTDTHRTMDEMIRFFREREKELECIYRIEEILKAPHGDAAATYDAIVAFSGMTDNSVDFSRFPGRSEIENTLRTGYSESTTNARSTTWSGVVHVTLGWIWHIY